MDFSQCLPSTICWALSALSYDEDKVQTYIMELFSSFRTHFWSHDRGAQFHGVVIDEREGRIFHVHRGTDGFDKIGNLRSWLTDLRIFTGDDGVHNGFQRYGDRAFDEAKRYLENYNDIFITGHSQGSGVGQYDCCLCVENLTLSHVEANLFAVPPCFNQTGADRFNAHLRSGLLSCNRFVNPNDPIAASWLRNKHALVLNGCDVGKEIVLPDITLFDLGPVEFLNHSCAQYNASYGLWLAQGLQHKHIYDYLLLGKIAKWLVN
jgi:hypothetical protein